MFDTGFFLVNKPEGYTSFEAVNFLKKKLKTKKVGHSGTLDPVATGLLIIGINSATKLLNYIINNDKSYDAVLRLGTGSDTLDRTGELFYDTEFSAGKISDELIEKTLNSFKGESFQIPPMYSAKKIKGRRLYELARKGIELERASVPVNIKKIILNKIVRTDLYIDVYFTVTVSKGTYIRVLCSDIADKLGTCGLMQELKRISIGKLSVENAVELKDVTPDDILDIEEVLEFPVVKIPNQCIKKFLNGATVTAFELNSQNEYSEYAGSKAIAKSEDDILLGLCEISSSKFSRIVPKKVFKQ